MPKLIHAGTKIEIRFAVIDDEGDISQIIPLPLELPKVTEEVLNSVFAKYLETKQDLEKQLLSASTIVSDTDTKVEEVDASKVE